MGGLEREDSTLPSVIWGSDGVTRHIVVTQYTAVKFSSEGRDYLRKMMVSEILRNPCYLTLAVRTKLYC